MGKSLPVLLATCAVLSGCQDSSTAQAEFGSAPVAAFSSPNSEWIDPGHPCPLLGIPTTVRYEIQANGERQFQVHLINTAEAPLAADCEQQHPLPGNVVMRYRLARRA